MDNELPYRGPFTPQPEQTASADDENNYNTIVEQHRILKTELKRLHSIDGIDVSKRELTVKQQIVANQIAYDILLPICEALGTAIEDVKNNWRR